MKQQLQKSKRQRTEMDSRWGLRYIERQERAECGRHALNNVFGLPVFTHEEMEIAAQQVLTELDIHDAHERAQHINPTSGWYSHSVLARALQNVREQDYSLQLEPVSPNAYGHMLTTNSIQGAIINENQVHWSAIRKRNDLLWHVDSLPPRATALTEGSFANLIRQFPGKVFYVLVGRG